MYNTHLTWVPAACVAAVLCTTGPSFGLNSFHLGNSLTDQVIGLKDYAVGKGHQHTLKHVTIPGVGLEFHAGVSLAGSWDAVVPQPFRNGSDLGIAADAKYCGMFWDRALAGNAQSRLYIFGQWPRMGEGSWESQWNRKFDASQPGYAQPYESAVYPESLAARMTAKYPNRAPCRVIPVGHVMEEIRKRIAAGTVTGLKDVWALYEDGVHLNSKGKYLQVVTHYAVIYNDRPHNGPVSGISFWSGPYSVPADFAAMAWDLVWDVVTQRKDITGVTGSPSGIPSAPLTVAARATHEYEPRILVGLNGRRLWVCESPLSIVSGQSLSVLGSVQQRRR